MGVIKRYYKKAAYVFVAIVVFYALAQPLLDELFPTLKEHPLTVYFLIVLLVSLIPSFMFLLDDRLDKIEKLNTSIVNLGLEEAVNEAAAKLNNNIKEMKVFAFTTAVIHPIIRSAKFSIGECKLMLHQFDVEKSSMANARYLSEHNEQIIQKWSALENDQTISDLRVVKYADQPMDYFIVMDDKILIQGFYHYEDNSPYGNEYEKPVVITSDNIESHKYIIKASRRFDNIWKYWLEKSGEAEL